MSVDAVLVTGLAGFYLWFLLAQAHITEKLFWRWRANEGWAGELINCPFCAGFWLAGALLLASGHYDPLTHLATATVVGVVGHFVA